MPHELKDVLTLAGVLGGCYSAVRLVWGDIRDWRRKPRLKIEFTLPEDLREWEVLDAGRKQKVATVHVRNSRRTLALRCVAILRPLSMPAGVALEEREFTLHWADTDYTAHSNISEPVDIGLERRRLDVTFAILVEGQAPQPGAWIAIPLALTIPAKATQAYLPPGEYRFRLMVECANGKGASKEFLISSPTVWTALSMRPTN